jgi:hypothetical protein
MAPTVQTDRTIPNNKPDSVMRDNKNGTRVFMDGGICGDRNVVKKDAENIPKYTAIICLLKYKDLKTEIQRMWKVKNKSNAGNNTGKWNHFTITQTITEQHTGKARNQVITENNHIGHCAQTAGSADVTVQNAYHWE